MSLKEPSEESIIRSRHDSVENIVLSNPKDDLEAHSKPSIQLPILRAIFLPSEGINPRKHAGTRPIPSAEHLPLERIQSNIFAEENSSPSSSQPSFIEAFLSVCQHGFEFWKRVFSDSFRWQMFKSLLLLAAGLKISKEYYKLVNSTETPATDVNNREAWQARCKKRKDKKEVIGKSTEK